MFNIVHKEKTAQITREPSYLPPHSFHLQESTQLKTVHKGAKLFCSGSSPCMSSMELQVPEVNNRRNTKLSSSLHEKETHFNFTVYV